jgi:hypothetical protein
VRANINTLFWIGALGFQNQSEPFSFRDGRWKTVITHVSHSCWASLSKQKILPKRGKPASVQHVERGSSRAPRRVAAPRSPHSHRARKSRGFAAYFGIPCQDNIPLAFCLTDRSTIRDEEKSDRTDDGGASEPFLLLYAVVGWTCCRPLVMRPKETLIN